MKSLLAWKTTVCLAVTCLGAAITAPAQTFNSLATAYSWGSLVQGTDGNLYGAYYAGGTEELGEIFKVTPEGVLSTIHNFTTEEYGNNPTGLALGVNGLLYGTTKLGGASGTCPGQDIGCGTVFEITAEGTLSVLHSFSGPDGSYPLAGLTLGPDGNLYGTTYGTNDGSAGAIYGTIFKITPADTFTTLYTFSSSDGYWPSGPLLLGADGRLYGTTTAGADGGGTVFAITTGGIFSTVHSFDNGIDGYSPTGSLVQAADGNLYGTASLGGPNCDGSIMTNDGTIFYVSPGGHTFASLYHFSKICDNGGPETGLVLGSDGNFYGGAGGSDLSEVATLFEITPKADFTTLHTFDYSTYPYLDGLTLMQHTNGTFYGTVRPGVNLPPQVFSFSNGLAPFIATVPQMRPIGQKVLILGQGLTGATSVTFNGVAATFTVNSDTEITATVPAGATKGYVQVTTPNGILSTTGLFYIG
jgi:uncharacterized repeat protein (TIGR03803 family)